MWLSNVVQEKMSLGQSALRTRKCQFPRRSREGRKPLCISLYLPRCLYLSLFLSEVDSLMLLSVEADGSLHIFEKGRNTHTRTTAEHSGLWKDIAKIWHAIRKTSLEPVLYIYVCMYMYISYILFIMIIFRKLFFIYQ